MKQIVIVLSALLVISLGVSAFALVAGGSAKEITLKEDQITVVKTADQKEVEVPKELQQEKVEIKYPEGDNLALNKKAKANGFTDVYIAGFAVDGEAGASSYWEGKEFAKAGGSNTISVDLDAEVEFNQVCLKLNPDKIWSKRTQTFSIEGSTDGKTWTEIVPSAEYKFTPKTGNFVVVDFDTVKYSYIQLTFTQNSGAGGGQIAELEVYNQK